MAPDSSAANPVAPVGPDSYAAPQDASPYPSANADPYATPAPEPADPVLGPPFSAPSTTLPSGLWAGVEPQELPQLLGAVALPSPSPILADTIAKALASEAGDSGGEPRLNALLRSGRVGELEQIAQSGGGKAASYAAALLAGLDKHQGTDVRRASPALLYRLANDEGTPPLVRLQAAERAAALNVIEGQTLAKVYRAAASALPGNAASGPALRARLFVKLDSATAGKFKAESLDALLASGADVGIEFPLGQALAQASADLAQAQIADYAESGLRVAALAGDEGSAWAWADAGGLSLARWQLLLAAADPYGPRADSALQAGAELAMKGGLPPALLHRLVTVLDALDYNVPIPLWEAASRTPQPDDGYLPETGLLSRLKEAADANQPGRTLLLATAVLGPQGPAGAHLIALGDAVRALKAVGFDAQARRLGFEALYAHWPKRAAAHP